MTGDIAGARWWKFDFHTHTPASEDYGKGKDQKRLRQISPKEWLLGFMQAGIDCVAITDHNSGAWIGKLQDAYRTLQRDKPAAFRPLHLFPGVEITVSGGIHLLAILDPSRDEAHINALLGAAGIRNPDLGKINAITSRSLLDVVGEIRKATGIAIPAHADGPKGIFKEARGETLKDVLRCDQIIAAEVLDKKQIYTGAVREQWNGWSCVLGSDSHHPTGDVGENFPGSRFSWIKMGTPDIEGLRLALIDGDPLSVLRSDETRENLYEHPQFIIESVAIREARYAGRPEPLEARFSPWLSALVGGRGTGKSTVVEMLRLALRREQDLPEDLATDFSKFKAVSASREEEGALAEDTEVVARIRKNDKRFCVRWRQDGEGNSIEEQDEDQCWSKAPGEVQQRFPVRIFSQKHVLSLSRDPRALLRLIDDDPTVDRNAWSSQHRQIEARYLSLRSQAREIVAALAERERIEGELADVHSKIKIFEGAGHKQLSTSYQRVQRQKRAVEDRFTELKENAGILERCAADIEPTNVPADEFDVSVPEEAEAHKLLLEARSKQTDFASRVTALANEISDFQTEWMRRVETSTWRQATQRVDKEYQALRQELQTKGVADPASFGVLVQRRQTLESKLGELDAMVNRKKELDQEAGAALDRIEASRIELSRKRCAFLAEVAVDNKYVRVTPVPWGSDPAPVEDDFRKVLNKTDGRLKDDILSEDGEKGILAGIYLDLPEDPKERSNEVSKRIQGLKHDLEAIRRGEKRESVSRWFRNHVRELPDETMDRVRLWWPEDSLKVEYSRDAEIFTPIEQGSPGQKSAAILAFLLSYGDEPLVLDQPEDDLDNHLIYELIVQQIRENKRRRQVIVVTHNPNIVVNGDAEMVIEMDHRKGQCVVVDTGTGCLQEDGVREAICGVMEGGKQAFQDRYRRLVN